MQRQGKKQEPPGRRSVLLAPAALLALAVAALAIWFLAGRSKPAVPAPSTPTASFGSGRRSDTYATSARCESCHQQIFQAWKTSHHALAERPPDPALDATAFDPPRKISHGSQVSESRSVGGDFQLITTGLEGRREPFPVKRVIGVSPLRQFLTPAAGGRFQVTELAFDPNHPGWFDVYGEDDRKPGEWGHWTGRGMTWNVMCAACHNTHLAKNYDTATDTYATSMSEMGVGCESCHGPLSAHSAWQADHHGADPSLPHFARDQMLAVCGSCHARRAELTGHFQPGDNFHDHYFLTIPDETGTFYPDGQVHEENYEFTAFLGSKMHDVGVSCMDCHDPHSGKTILSGNALCLRCHGPPVPPAPRIDPATHTHHATGTPGDNCVDCHMPSTVYMQRHTRHDHGFTIPDPLLTKEFGVPNACSRCHTDRDADWALAAIQSWNGPKLPRPSHLRAETIARARAGDKDSVPDLLRLLRTETNSLWRASSAALLGRWVNDSNVLAALIASAGDTDPLVRARSIHSLESLAQSPEAPAWTLMHERLNDPVRAVRNEAAWALRVHLDTNSTAGSELLAEMKLNADEPTGELQLGMFHLDRRDSAAALECFQRAVQWDPNSAPFHEALGVALSVAGKPEDAVTELRAACRIAPRDAECQFKLGLALNEAGRLDEARAALAEAVAIDPQFAKGWYDLGLACNAAGQTDQALEDLLRAESIDSTAAQIPYARATILARLGRVTEARAALRRALEIQPDYPEARNFLQALPP